MYLTLTVEVKDQEDEEVVRSYYSLLVSTFESIFELGAFGFDTPRVTIETGDDKGFSVG